jgi:hypothetical protein
LLFAAKENQCHDTAPEENDGGGNPEDDFVSVHEIYC